MNPLERAARALHKDYVENRRRMGVAPCDLPAWDDLGSDGKFSFYAPARAVLEAIREPSADMIRAGEAWQQHCSDVDSLFSEMLKVAIFGADG